MNVLRIAGIAGALLMPGAGIAAGVAQLDDLTTEEARYFGAASTLSGMMGASFDRTEELTANPRIQDLDWQNDFLGEVAIWRAVYDRAEELDPPDRLQEVHETSLEGYELFDEAAVETRAAIEALDLAGLGNAAVLIVEGGEKLTEAGELLAEVE